MTVTVIQPADDVQIAGEQLAAFQEVGSALLDLSIKYGLNIMGVAEPKNSANPHFKGGVRIIARPDSRTVYITGEKGTPQVKIQKDTPP